MNEARMTPASSVVGREVTWSGLRDQVRRHLERQGLSHLQAERCSHEIVVRCAAELGEGDPARLPERVMAEAETMLIGWRADLLPAA